MAINVELKLYKNAIGAGFQEHWTFQLTDQTDTVIDQAQNSSEGLIELSHTFDEAGVYYWSVREVSEPPEWTAVRYEFPVTITIVANPADPSGFHAKVEYPEGTPGFVNRKNLEPCSLVEFPELEFTSPGVYEYVMKETGGAGGGWTTDNTEYPVVITVVDDGFGNLIATVYYPQGFPEFRNYYQLEPVRVVISAHKIAIGAPLPCGRFTFGLYKEDGTLVATARNQ